MAVNIPGVNVPAPLSHACARHADGLGLHALTWGAAVVEPWLWVMFTLVAALSQTVRNVLQKSLTGPLGTAGATYVRFVYGLPFAILFFVGILLVTGAALPIPDLAVALWTAAGALTQVAATAMLLLAMQGKSFVVVTAYTKTEPIQVAIFGLVLLGDHLTLAMTLAIILATIGVVLMSWPRKDGAALFAWRPTLLGLGAASLFGLSAVAYRGAIVRLPGDSYLANASGTLVLALFLQTGAIVAWLLLRDRKTLRTMAGEWKASLPAGFVGALASQGWFLAFALESAARVRTLGLVEIIFAQVLARRLFGQNVGWREWTGIGLVAIGVAWLLHG